MTTYQQSIFTNQQKTDISQGSTNPLAKEAQAGAEDAMAFQLWVSEQSQALGRLKVFHTMAKQINDQQ